MGDELPGWLSSPLAAPLIALALLALCFVLPLVAAVHDLRRALGGGPGGE